MEIPLKHAPDRFLDQQKWSEFISHFDTREIALYRLSGPPYDLAGFYQGDDAKLVNAGEGRQKQIHEAFELGIALVGELKTKLIKGHIRSSGLPAGFIDVERELIAPELWAKLWPDFVENCAHGPLFGFTQVRVCRDSSRQALAAEMLEYCTSFLRDRSAEGEDRRKVLEKEASERFGIDLRTRIFSAAYWSVFKKSGGRPRTKK